MKSKFVKYSSKARRRKALSELTFVDAITSDKSIMSDNDIMNEIVTTGEKMPIDDDFLPNILDPIEHK